MCFWLRLHRKLDVVFQLIVWFWFGNVDDVYANLTSVSAAAKTENSENHKVSL